MAEKSSISSLNALLAFALIIGLLLWAWMIFSAQGEKRLEQACKPIEYSTQFLHDITSSVIGRQPTWTLYVQRYLMTGCYYTFSVAFAQHAQSDSVQASFGEGEPATGGIQE